MTTGHPHGRDIYNLEPAPGYWQRQLEKGLYPYIAGMLKTHLPSPARLLEIGCEAGRATLPLQMLGYQMTGLDVVAAPLKFARENEPSQSSAVQWIQGDGQNLPLKDQTFDGVLLIQQNLSMFHGRENRLQVLKEAHRVLNANGQLFISIQNRPFQTKLWPGLPFVLYFIYSKMFIYPIPVFNRNKWRELRLRFRQWLTVRKYLKIYPEQKNTGDIFIKAQVSDVLRKNIPFHMYHFDELIVDLQDAKFQVQAYRDYIEFEKGTCVPKMLRRGAPYLIFVAKKY